MDWWRVSLGMGDEGEDEGCYGVICYMGENNKIKINWFMS